MPKTKYEQTEPKMIDPEISGAAEMIGQSLEMLSTAVSKFERAGSAVDAFATKLRSVSEGFSNALSTLNKLASGGGGGGTPSGVGVGTRPLPGDPTSLLQQISQMWGQPSPLTGRRMGAGSISKLLSEQAGYSQMDVQRLIKEAQRGEYGDVFKRKLNEYVHQPNLERMQTTNMAPSSNVARTWSDVQYLNRKLSDWVEKQTQRIASLPGPEQQRRSMGPTPQTQQPPWYAPTQPQRIASTALVPVSQVGKTPPPPPPSPATPPPTGGPKQLPVPTKPQVIVIEPKDIPRRGGFGPTATGAGGGYLPPPGGPGGGEGRNWRDWEPPPGGGDDGGESGGSRGGGRGRGGRMDDFLMTFEMMNPFAPRNLAWLGMFAFSGQLQPATMALSQPTMMAGQHYQNVVEGLKQFGSSFSGLPKLSGLFQQIIQTDAFDLYESMHQSFTVLKNVYSSSTRAEKIMGQSIQLARSTPLEVRDLLGIFSTFSVNPELRGILSNRQQMTQLATGVAGLSFLVPEQGTEGAIFAIREALAGQYRSIKRRFNISPEIIASSAGMTLGELKEKPVSFLEALDIFLKQNLGQNTFTELQDTFTKQVGNIYDSLMGGIFRGFRETSIYSNVTMFAKETSNVVDRLFKSDVFGNFFQNFSQSINTNFTRAVDVLRTIDFDRDPPEQIREKAQNAFQYAFSSIIKDTIPAVDALKEVVTPIASKLSDAMISSMSRTVGSIFTGMMGAGVKQTILLGTSVASKLVPGETLSGAVEQMGESFGTFATENPFLTIGGLAVASKGIMGRVRGFLTRPDVADAGGVLNYLSARATQSRGIGYLMSQSFLGSRAAIPTFMAPAILYQFYRDYQKIQEATKAQPVDYEQQADILQYMAARPGAPISDIMDQINALGTNFETEKIRFGYGDIATHSLLAGSLAQGALGRVTPDWALQRIGTLPQNRFVNAFRRPTAWALDRLASMSTLRRQFLGAAGVGSAVGLAGLMMEGDIDVSKRFMADYRQGVGLVHTLGSGLSMLGFMTGNPYVGLAGVALSVGGEFAVSKYYEHKTDEYRKTINKRIEENRQIVNKQLSSYLSILDKQPEEIVKTLSQDTGELSNVLGLIDVMGTNWSQKRDEYFSKLVSSGDIGQEQSQKLKGVIARNIKRISSNEKQYKALMDAIGKSNVERVKDILSLTSEDVGGIRNEQLFLSAIMAEALNLQQQLQPTLATDLMSTIPQSLIERTRGTAFGNVLRRNYTGEVQRTRTIFSLDRQQRNLNQIKESLEDVFTASIMTSMPEMKLEKAQNLASKEVSRVYDLDKVSGIMNTLRQYAVSERNFYESQVFGLDEFAKSEINRNAGPRTIFQEADERVKALRQFDQQSIGRLFLSRSVDMFGQQSALPWIGYQFAQKNPQMMSPELFREFSTRTTDLYGQIFEKQVSQYWNVTATARTSIGELSEGINKFKNVATESQLNESIKKYNNAKNEFIDSVVKLMDTRPIESAIDKNTRLYDMAPESITSQQLDREKVIEKITKEAGTWDVNKMREYLMGEMTRGLAPEERGTVLERIDKEILPKYGETLKFKNVSSTMENLRSFMQSSTEEITPMLVQSMNAQQVQNVYATMQNYLEQVYGGMGTSMNIMGMMAGGVQQTLGGGGGLFGYVGMGETLLPGQITVGGVRATNPFVLSEQRKLEEESQISQEDLNKLQGQRSVVREQWTQQMSKVLNFMVENPEQVDPAMLKQVAEYQKMGVSMGFGMSGEQRAMLAQVQLNMLSRQGEVVGSFFDEMQSGRMGLAKDILSLAGQSGLDLGEIGGKSPIDDLVRAKDGIVGALQELKESLSNAAKDIGELFENLGTTPGSRVEVPSP